MECGGGDEYLAHTILDQLLKGWNIENVVGGVEDEVTRNVSECVSSEKCTGDCTPTTCSIGGDDENDILKLGYE